MRLLQVSLLLLLFGLSGCYREDLDKCPTHARLVIRADWSGRGAEEVEPSAYMVRVGDLNAQGTQNTFTFPHPIEPGNHNVKIHTEPDNVNISGDIATIATTRAGVIDHMPGCLFTYTEDVVGLKKGVDHTVHALMKQQMRMLNIVVESASSNVTDHISSASYTLDGLASSLDMFTEDLTDPSSIAVNFEPNTTGDKLVAKAKLLGVVPGETNTLHLVFELANNTVQTMDIDLTSRLSLFNTDKSETESITITINEVSQVSGEIIAWTVKGGYTGNVN